MQNTTQDFSVLVDQGEPVRAVVWDLDETFWRGTITEGGVVDYIEEYENLVVEFAQRGIISSICSKNEFEVAKALLIARRIWDYFVMPSIGWSPKGVRINQIVENMQLRPETVLFIDDNPHNLAEAAAWTPGLLIANEKAIPTLREHPRLRGKYDKEMTRLAQYKLLEHRKRDEREAKGGTGQFLRDSGITVTIEHDVSAHLERAVEIINRTNQLNFTKVRLPEDVEEAKRQLREMVSATLAWAGLVKVTDRYGDYGFVGFYLGYGGLSKELAHFCFSCRTLGMDIETWVYRRLGSPTIQIKGEVLADIRSPHQIDWINLSSSNDNLEGNAASIPEVRLRGGCDLDAMVHLFWFCYREADRNQFRR